MAKAKFIYSSYLGSCCFAAIILPFLFYFNVVSYVRIPLTILLGIVIATSIAKIFFLRWKLEKNWSSYLVASVLILTSVCSITLLYLNINNYLGFFVSVYHYFAVAIILWVLHIIKLFFFDKHRFSNIINHIKKCFNGFCRRLVCNVFFNVFEFSFILLWILIYPVLYSIYGIDFYKYSIFYLVILSQLFIGVLSKLYKRLSDAGEIVFDENLEYGDISKVFCSRDERFARYFLPDNIFGYYNEVRLFGFNASCEMLMQFFEKNKETLVKLNPIVNMTFELKSNQELEQLATDIYKKTKDESFKGNFQDIKNEKIEHKSVNLVSIFEIARSEEKFEQKKNAISQIKITDEELKLLESTESYKLLTNNIYGSCISLGFGSSEVPIRDHDFKGHYWISEVKKVAETGVSQKMSVEDIKSPLDFRFGFPDNLINSPEYKEKCSKVQKRFESFVKSHRALF